jgi:hypothetical protein
MEKKLKFKACHQRNITNLASKTGLLNAANIAKIGAREIIQKKKKK